MYNRYLIRGIMKYDQIKELSEEQFRRLTGVKKATLKRMLEILREADAKKKAKGGRKSKLSIEDQLLMALEYTGIHNMELNQ